MSPPHLARTTGNATRTLTWFLLTGLAAMLMVVCVATPTPASAYQSAADLRAQVFAPAELGSGGGAATLKLNRPRELHLVVTAANQGSAPTQGPASVTLRVPASFRVLAAAARMPVGERATCRVAKGAAEHVVTCSTAGPLAPYHQLWADVWVRPLGPTAGTGTATVGSATADLNPANDRSSLAVSFTGRLTRTEAPLLVRPDDGVLRARRGVARLRFRCLARVRCRTATYRLGHAKVRVPRLKARAQRTVAVKLTPGQRKLVRRAGTKGLAQRLTARDVRMNWVRLCEKGCVAVQQPQEPGGF